ncbi:MAG: hypothetical protein IJL92_09230 [Thermoguttaceae bacterium]|nr:hypothetical protein [Thermoguttaceae bacterium]
MSDLDREKLIDYVLGRMCPEDSVAFEQRVRKEPELARSLSTLRAELVSCSTLAGNNQVLQSLLNRKVPNLTSEKVEAGSDVLEESVSDSFEPSESESVSSSENRADSLSPAKRNKKRLRFIPKRVVVPRRVEDAALIFKRAAILTDEERRRKLATPSRMTKAQLRSFFSHLGVSYRWSDVIPNVAGCFSSTSYIDSDALIRSSATFDELEESFVSSPSDFDSREIRIEAPLGEFDSPAINQVPFDSDELRISTENVERLPGGIAVVSGVNDVPSESSLIFSEPDVESEIATRYTLNPLEYVNGRAVPVEPSVQKASDEPLEAPHEELSGVSGVAEPYEFDELDAKIPETPTIETAKIETPSSEKLTSEQELSAETPTPSFESVAKSVAEPVAEPVAESVAEPVVSAKSTFTREEVLAEAAAVFGQSAKILLQTSPAYYAVERDAEDDEENGPTLTAEDRLLAELLGHEPSAIERNEYYWEEENARHNDDAENIKSHGLLTKAFLLVTAPPVWVGRLAIGAFHLFVPEDFERKEARSQTRRRSDKREPGRVVDVVVPMVAGIALAVGVVFPALKYVATEIFITVAESRVRKLSGNVTLSPEEAEFDVIPLISEQILFPRYEAVEFDGATRDPDSMENDGLPVMKVDE